MNMVALTGRLSRPPEERVLESGTRLMTLQVTTEGPGARPDTVPVAWFEPPARAVELDTDDRVLVVGRVRRRFFQAGGRTQSRTEVVADDVVDPGRASTVRKVVAGLVQQLATELDPAARAPDARPAGGVRPTRDTRGAKAAASKR